MFHLLSLSQMETRKRLAKIVLVLVFLFALCWFPNHLLYMYRSFHYQQMDLSLRHLVVTLLARVLSFSSSCVNPFALYLLSESFRRHFNRWCHSQGQKKSVNRYQMVSELVDLLLLLLLLSQLRCGRGPHPQRQVSYLHSTSHIRLTSFKKATPTVAAANGSSARQEVAL